MKFYLRYCLFILFFLWIGIPAGYGQSNLNISTHYLFPEFTKGTVLMKTGIRNEAILNYNMLTNEMIFDQKGTKLALDRLDQIDTIFILNRKFIPFDHYFLELIYKSNCSLYAGYRCKLKDPGKPTAYGGTSQTSAGTSYSTYITGGRSYEMKLPEGFETQSSVEYWLEKDGKMNKFLNIRQLSKLFEEKESLFKSYVKQHDVKFGDVDRMIELLRYMQTN